MLPSGITNYSSVIFVAHCANNTPPDTFLQVLLVILQKFSFLSLIVILIWPPHIFLYNLPSLLPLGNLRYPIIESSCSYGIPLVYPTKLETLIFLLLISSFKLSLSPKALDFQPSVPSFLTQYRNYHYQLGLPFHSTDLPSFPHLYHAICFIGSNCKFYISKPSHLASPPQW